MNSENVDPSPDHEVLTCHNPVLESRGEGRNILSTKSLVSENIKPNIDAAINKTTLSSSEPLKIQEGKSRPPRSKASRTIKGSHIPLRSIPSKSNSSSSRVRKRSSSVSSLQRLTDKRYFDENSASDDASACSTGSTSSFRSVKSARQTRRPNDINSKRGRSRNRTSYSAASTPTGYRSDDLSVGSTGSVSSYRSARSTQQSCVSSSTYRPRHACAIPKVINGKRGVSRSRTPTGYKSAQEIKVKRVKGSVMQLKTDSSAKYNWTEEQRKTKEERNKRRLQQTTKSNDILLQELNRSYNRPGPCDVARTAISNERPNKLSKKVSTADCVKTAEESTDKLSEVKEPPSHKKKKAFTPVSTIKKMASGLYASPKRSAHKREVGMKSPMSYSKAVKMGGTPQFIRKLFDDKTRDMLKELSGVDVNTNDSHKLAGQIFGIGTGISDDEVRKILNAKASITNKWELKKQLEERSETVKVLKSTLHQLMKGKNKHVTSTIETEKTTKRSWAKAVHIAKECDGERQKLKESIKEKEVESTTMKEEKKDKIRELNSSEEKVSSLESELVALKTKFDASIREHTEACIALEVEKTRCQEAEKNTERLQHELSSMEACKAEAVNQAQTFITKSVERDKNELREEVTSLISRIEIQEKELGKLIGRKESGAQVNDIKEEMDKLRNQAHNFESHLTLREAELSRAVLDGENAKEAAASKDIALRDLMKGLSDIQRSSQVREDEANSLRKQAESKSSDLEIVLADLNGKNTFVTHEKVALEESINTMEKELKQEGEMINTLKVEVNILKQDINSSTSQLQLEKELRAQSCQKEREERNERIALSAQMVAMTKEHAEIEVMLKESLSSTIRQYEEKLDNKDILFSEKEKESSDHQEGIARLEAEILSLKQALNDEMTMAQAKSAEVISGLKGEINMLKERMKIAEHKSLSVGAATAEQVENFETEISECHAERRRMHNLVQELRGNVRVFARVRPFLPADCADDNAQPCVLPNGESSMKLVVGGDQLQSHSFTFDRVFPQSTSQDAVFTEVSEFVQSALDGYNVCLFSYGQTGSGKTHTMQGSGSGQMRGIIPRSIEQVGKYKGKLERDRGWKYEMCVSFIEIYNETIRDLLREKENDEKKHEIKVNNQGRRYISDIKMIPLDPTNADAVEGIMHLAAKRRSVGATDMNATSSRSHSIFTLHLTAYHPENGQELRGSLNLVDLAGSERLDRSKATGDRAKEAMAINKSLSCLSEVFLAIGKKSSHIPFRNSKLTYLLQPALSGDGKSLMLVNLSPSESSVQESLCSLRFASQVNKCELGRATSSVKSGSKSKKISTKLPTPPGTQKSVLSSLSPNKRQILGSATKRNVRSRFKK